MAVVMVVMAAETAAAIPAAKSDSGVEVGGDGSDGDVVTASTCDGV